MKNIFLISLSVLVLSCASELKIIDPYKSTVLIDFTRFSEKDFLFTPERYIGSYKSIGLIDFTIKPGARYLSSGRMKNPNYRPGTNDPQYIDRMIWYIDDTNWNNALDEVYKLYIDMGADVMMNFKLELTEDQYINIKNPVIIIGYRITGFAIKRNDH